MKVYYARPINLYESVQDKRDIECLEKLGFEISNPNKEILQERYKTEGMPVFIQIITDCDLLAFRSCPDGKITAGVYKEIIQAQELGKPVIELPTLPSTRVLTIEDTRLYLQNIGAR